MNRAFSRSSGFVPSRALLASGLLTIQAFAFQAAVADDWSYYQHDAAHTGASTANLDPTALSLAWSAPAGYSLPIVSGNTVFASQTSGGGIYAPNNVTSFALSNGAINWSNSIGSIVPSPPAVGGGFVVYHGVDISTLPPWHEALYVLNELTGVLLYSVPVPSSFIQTMPTLVPYAPGVTLAFIANNGSVSAVLLGPISGSILWTQNVDGGTSMPTVVGNSIVVAGYAFDQLTGAANHFYGGPTGGGGITAAYDSTRSQFYVLDDALNALSAYHYTDNNNITLAWRRSGISNGLSGLGSVAVAPNGNVYCADNSIIQEVDPTTGATLNSISGSFANGMTPALTQGVLWAYSETQTLAYDLATRQLLRSFNGSQGSSNDPYSSPGAFSDGYFLLDYGGTQGFDVYAGGPTPGAPPIPTLYQPPLRKLPHP